MGFSVILVGFLVSVYCCKMRTYHMTEFVELLTNDPILSQNPPPKPPKRWMPQKGDNMLSVAGRLTKFLLPSLHRYSIYNKTWFQIGAFHLISYFIFKLRNLCKIIAPRMGGPKRSQEETNQLLRQAIVRFHFFSFSSLSNFQSKLKFGFA